MIFGSIYFLQPKTYTLIRVIKLNLFSFDFEVFNQLKMDYKLKVLIIKIRERLAFFSLCQITSVETY